MEVRKIISGEIKDLRGVKLKLANLKGANLECANLRDVDLKCANLRDADLKWADLECANLEGANLRGANLRWAKLEGANLECADLRGTDLEGTCLDPVNTPNAKSGEFEIIKTRNNTEWAVAYRTSTSTNVGYTKYRSGELHEAPVFSTSDTECHPGIYFWPTIKEAEEWSDLPVVKVLVRPYEIHKAGDKYRARWILVV